MSILETSGVEALEQGFRDLDGQLRCLYCEAAFEHGVVYPVDSRLLAADRAAREHVVTAHGGPFQALLEHGGHGLSEVQAQVVALSHQDLSDKDIAAGLGGRSTSTVRNHRFQLRRRHREARAVVALMDMLEARVPEDSAFVEFHPAMPMADDRTAVTNAEAEALLDKYFEDATRTRLVRFPKKQKHKLVVLRHLAKLFEPGSRYAEREVSDALGAVFDDYATLRRYLVEYKFLARVPDGSAYWRVDDE